MSWRAKLTAARETAREWWSDLDSEQQYLVALAGLTIATALVQQLGRPTMPESIVHLRIEDKP